MAEFMEVMKQKKRLHEYQVQKWDNDIVSSCTDCPLNIKEVIDICNGVFDLFPEEAEKIIMKWAKEHPIKTNADKFKEVFGVIPDQTTEWWNSEYKEPSEVWYGTIRKNY